MANELLRCRRLQKLLNTVKQTKQASLERAGRALDERRLVQLALLKCVADNNGTGGKYLELVSRRLEKLAREGHTLELRKSLCEAEFWSAAARARAAEGLLSKARDATALEFEKRALADVQEHILLQGWSKNSK